MSSSSKKTVVSVAIGVTTLAVLAAFILGDPRALTRLRTLAAANLLADSAHLASKDSLVSARQDSINRAQPGYVVDSIIPVEEEIRRFRVAAGKPVSSLRGGEASRDALVASFVRAVEHSDSAALTQMTLSLGEFAYLVYPSSPYTKAPFRQPPGLLWRTIASPSQSGATRLLRRVGGRRLGFAGYRCDDTPQRQGDNRLYTGCVIDLAQPDGAIARRRLFGTIIERRGRFKFVSLQNDM